MEKDTTYIEVILPLNLAGAYTYRVPNFLQPQVALGKRVVIPFGVKNRPYTGIISKIFSGIPNVLNIKYVQEILDKNPLLNNLQLQFWQWIADYYMSNMGLVMNAALPSSFKLDYHQEFIFNQNFDELTIDDFSAEEYLVYEAVKKNDIISFKDAEELLSPHNPNVIINKLLKKRVILISQVLSEKYTPKQEYYIKLSDDIQEVELLIDTLSKAPKQQAIVLVLVQFGRLKEHNQRKVLASTKSSLSSLKALEKKGYIVRTKQQVDRVFINATVERPIVQQKLSIEQEKGLKKIKELHKQKDVVLLKGVTGSGKTELYVTLIKEAIAKKKQVLYLLPEIALTKQFIKRLQSYFGKEIAVFHSKLNDSEKVEIWNRVLVSKKESDINIILGVRSSIFLPFSNLGLIIVDEEHESSYKQQDPSPRYHARDTAIVLAKLHEAKVVLGSATPSSDTYYNALIGKYGLVELHKRYNQTLMPMMSVVDMKQQKRIKRVNRSFSEILINQIKEQIAKNKQVILFRNRRGYSPYILCNSCGYSPECPSCDVTLTYHKSFNQLKCHLCGFSRENLTKCKACGVEDFSTQGTGTEKIVEELAEIIEGVRILRIDSDTMRKKNAFDEALKRIENNDVDVMIGTQMISKGLDFSEVALVGVLNADALFSYPDFRAYEKAFQLLLQVGGRAGRRKQQGKVLIQAYDIHAPVINYALNYDYEGLFNYELAQRKQFSYPPFFRLIHFMVKAKDLKQMNQAVEELAILLKKHFGNNLIGPSFPNVMRTKNYYQKQLLLKFERTRAQKLIKQSIKRIIIPFEGTKNGKKVRIVINVDPL